MILLSAKALSTEIAHLRRAIEAAYPIEVWLTPTSHGLSVSTIEVPKGLRGAGVGSQAMLAILAFADHHGLIVSLTPEARHGSSKTGLHRWYRRLGFAPNKGRRKRFEISDSWYRKPQ